MTTALQNRLIKKKKHLEKWPKRLSISCYRLYDKELTEYPFILDWYDGHMVAWVYGNQETDLSEDIISQLTDVFSIPSEHIFVKQRRRQKGLQSQYKKLQHEQFLKVIQEGGLSFEVNLSDYLDTGLFLDHRQTRAWVKSLSENASVLNLFAYTGSFTCYAIAGGANRTITVDLNQNYTAWTRRNMALNGFKETKEHQLITLDCQEFLKKMSAPLFDLIICDPPTFSNSKKMNYSFALDHHYPVLIQACCRQLRPEGRLIFSHNMQRFKFDDTCLPSGFVAKEITYKTIPLDFKSSFHHRCWEIRKTAS